MFLLGPLEVSCPSVAMWAFSCGENSRSEEAGCLLRAFVAVVEFVASMAIVDPIRRSEKGRRLSGFNGGAISSWGQPHGACRDPSDIDFLVHQMREERSS